MATKTGYISFITETGGGKDADGNSVPSTPVLSAYLPCNIHVVTREYFMSVDGQQQQAKYSVYLEQSKFDELEPVLSLESIFKVNVQDSNNNDLGTHQIGSREYLKYGKRIKILL